MMIVTSLSMQVLSVGRAKLCHVLRASTFEDSSRDVLRSFGVQFAVQESAYLSRVCVGPERLGAALGVACTGRQDALGGKDGIVALTYASHKGRDDRFCRAVESAVRENVPWEILGWGVKWEGLSQKLQASLDSVSHA